MSERTDSNLSGRLNLEQQKKRAKELLNQVKALEMSAIRRFQQYHPKIQHGQDFDLRTFQPRLSDAQLVIARENSLPSWPKLKAHIEQLNQYRRAIALGVAPTLDADRPTLHLRCGSDICNSLRLAGFGGDFLEFADPYCQGPVPNTAEFAEFLNQRAAFIASAYGIHLKDAHKRLEQEYHGLHQCDRYARVALWFEHDAYDQLILAYVLHHFWRSSTRPEQLELICADSFPGIRPFLGLGQLSPEALRVLWDQRQPVTSEHLLLGTRVWQAFTDSSPERLSCVIATGTPALPSLSQALNRHLQELPWIEDGLSLTERLTLEVLAENGDMSGGQLFKTLTLEKEPLPYLGDTMYWQVLTQLSECPDTPFEVVTGTEDSLWPKRLLRLSPVGQALLQRQAHWLQMNSRDRWVGGVLISRNQPIWQWDQRQQRPVLSL